MNVRIRMLLLFLVIMPLSKLVRFIGFCPLIEIVCARFRYDELGIRQFRCCCCCCYWSMLYVPRGAYGMDWIWIIFGKQKSKWRDVSAIRCCGFHNPARLLQVCIHSSCVYVSLRFLWKCCCTQCSLSLSLPQSYIKKWIKLWYYVPFSRTYVYWCLLLKSIWNL